MPDESTLEGRLSELKEKYKQPVSVYRPKEAEPMRYGPTITERISKNIGNIVGGIAVAGVVALIAGLIYFNVVYYPSYPGREVDRGSNYKIYLKGDQYVYISDVDGSNYRLLVGEGSGYDEWPQAVLSPDERRVVLVKKKKSSWCEIFVTNTDDSRLSQLTFPKDTWPMECDHDPFWVDNDTIGFLRSNDEEQYLQVDVNENNVGYDLRSYEPLKK